VKRLIVTGCPRSGNTLLHVMSGVCFKNTFSTEGEVGPRAPDARLRVPRTMHPDWVLLKYPEFVAPVEVGPFDKHWPRVKSVLRNQDTCCVMMVRDPRAVFLSNHAKFDRDFYMKGPERWVRAARVILEARKMSSTLLVRFETLVTNPGRVQRRMEERFGLERVADFESWHEHVRRPLDEENELALGPVRALDPSRAEAGDRWDENPRDGFMTDEVRELMQEFEYA
tara:strand:+ start:792 stop:1469 length:678 start_codon:yes stop_codon:yes gene_type:complete